MAEQTVLATKVVEFISTVALKEEGPFPTFKEALANFIMRMRELVRGGTSLQALETACFVEMNYGVTKRALLFYDLRDLAYSLGLLAGNGQLVPDATEPETAILLRAFQAV